MQKIYPDYYKNFRCIASRCTHNCCIGWEIDIDDNTAASYKSTEGELGERFRNNIDFDAIPCHFIHSSHSRCPFLNNNNLCDIITQMGEDSLCDICREHPRFHNELPGRIESGLGMCCEEAARIILTNKNKVKLCVSGEASQEDEIILLRDKVLDALQNRTKPIRNRIDDMLALLRTTRAFTDIRTTAKFMLTLERLDDNWGTMLKELIDTPFEDTAKEFDRYITDSQREYEYEQFAVYIIYRHFANAPDLVEAALVANFAALCFELMYSLGATAFYKNKEFTTSQQIELCRMFSSEIEYSDENTDKILDELYLNI